MDMRSRLVDEMMELASRAHKRVLKEGREAFLRLDDFGDDDAEVEPLDEEEEFDWADRWMHGILFDLPAGRDGEVVAEAYLRRMAAKLTDEERGWLEEMLKAPLTPFEVSEVRPGAGFAVKSLWDGQERFLTEPAASEDLSVGDVLALRVTRSGDVEGVEGGSYTFPEGARTVIEAEMKKYLEANEAEAVDDLDPAARRLFSVVLHTVWCELALEEPESSPPEELS